MVCLFWLLASSVVAAASPASPIPSTTLRATPSRASTTPTTFITTTLRGTPSTTIREPQKTRTSPSPTATCYLAVKARTGDTCASIAAVFNMDVATFRRMNPGVADCSHLVAGQTYCAAGAESAGAESDGAKSDGAQPATETTLPTAPSAPTSSAPPQHQAPITPSCRRWHLVAAGDTCAQIEAREHISDADFRAWNGFVNAGCTNLWLGYYCCVG